MEAPRHLYRHAFQLRILLGERERVSDRVSETDKLPVIEGQMDGQRETEWDM